MHIRRAWSPWRRQNQHFNFESTKKLRNISTWLRKCGWNVRILMFAANICYRGQIPRRKINKAFNSAYWNVCLLRIAERWESPLSDRKILMKRHSLVSSTHYLFSVQWIGCYCAFLLTVSVSSPRIPRWKRDVEIRRLWTLQCVFWVELLRAEYT